MQKPKKIETKKVHYLINEVRRKIDNETVPAYTLLIGAGCSYHTGIPLGSQVIELLKREIFRRDEISANPKDAGLNIRGEYAEYEKNYSTLLRKNDMEEQFQKFELQHRKNIEAEVNKFTDDQLDYVLPIQMLSTDKDERERKAANRKNFELVKKYVYDDYAYGYWFKQFSKDDKDRQIFLDALISEREPLYGYACLANLIKEDYVRTVFTTNFDDLLNEALMMYHFKPARILAHSFLSSYVDFRGKHPNIIKLHGDYMFQNMRNDDDQINRNPNQLADKLLEALCNQFDMVVLGYNGADYSIMRELENAKRNCKEPYNLIWCDRKEPENLHWRVKSLLQNYENSYYVKIESFDVLMVEMELNLPLPEMRFDERAKQMQEDLTKFKANVQAEIEKANSLSKEQKEAFRKRNNYWKKLGEASKSQDYEEKDRLFQEAIAINPEGHEAYYNWGIALTNLARAKSNDAFLYEQAIKKYEKATIIKPDKHEAFNNWGITLVTLARTKNNDEYLYKEAFEKYEKAVTVMPDKYEAYFNWGLALAALAVAKGKDEVLLKQAIEKYEKATILNPDYAIAYTSWSISLCHLADARLNNINLYVQALKLAEKAMAIQPTELVHYQNINACLLKILNTTVLLNRKEKVLKEIILNTKRARTISPYAESYNLACAYSITGKTNEALTELENAFANNTSIVSREYVETNDHDLANLRSLPKFKELLDKYKPILAKS